MRLFLTEIIEVDDATAEVEATSMKHSISEETVTKLESYIVKTMGLEDLNCNYNLANNACQKCIKTKTKIKN